MKNIDDYESILSENHLYFITGEADQCIEEKNGNKHIIFVSADNKEVLTQNFGMELKIWLKNQVDMENTSWKSNLI